MYQLDCSIIGIAPILQHKFSLATLSSIQEGARRKTGATDYSQEWLETMYVSDDGKLIQPASHIEGAMIKAASGFRIKGSRNQTYKDLFRAYIIVSPEQIVHVRNGQPVAAPGLELITKPTAALCVNLQRVIISRAAVARARLQINPGWQLSFTITVNDDQIRPEVVSRILEEAGRAVGIGDHRPKYGRFTVQRCAELPSEPV